MYVCIQGELSHVSNKMRKQPNKKRWRSWGPNSNSIKIIDGQIRSAVHALNAMKVPPMVLVSIFGRERRAELSHFWYSFAPQHIPFSWYLQPPDVESYLYLNVTCTKVHHLMRNVVRRPLRPIALPCAWSGNLRVRCMSAVQKNWIM